MPGSSKGGTLRPDEASHNKENTLTLHEQVAAAGGVVNLSAMAKAWGVSVQRAKQLTSHPTFPMPLPGVVDVWLKNEVNDWREDRQRMYGGKETG
jgi:hypothetical protein